MKNICLLFLSLACLTGCRVDLDEESKYQPPTTPQKAFEKEFTAKYGSVSPDITWMTTSASTIQLDLSEFPSNETYKVQVFTANPCEDQPYCYLLAEYSGIHATNTDIVFSYPTGLNFVYVSVVKETGESFTSAIDMREEIGLFKVDQSRPDSGFVEHNPMRYIIAYEGFTAGDDDVDTKLDFDYNDIVLELEYVVGHPTASVKILAAGCECEAKVVYHRSNNPDSGEEEILFDEAHETLGFKGVYSYMVKHLVYYALNTGINNVGSSNPVTVDLKEDVNAPVETIARRLFVYFTVLAEKSKNNKTTSSFIPSKPGSQYPQAILIADPDWKWPRERLLLSVVYSDFRPWIYEPAENGFWYGGEIWKEANKR